MTRSRPTTTLAAVLALAGCGREVAPGPAATEPPAAAPVPRAPAPPAAPGPPVSAAASPPASASAAPPAPRPFALLDLAPTQGDLLPLLRLHAGRARAQSLRPVAEFYADWCEPCRVFQRSLGDPEMVEALRGAYLVRLNMDDWYDKLRGTGFVVPSIPSFYRLGPEGRPAGRSLDGGRWGRATPARMAEALRAFLEG